MTGAAPLKLFETRVRPEWIDEFHHVNVAHYISVCDNANWAFWNLMNTPHEMADRDGHEYAILENHVNYINELALDEPIHVTTQLLAHDDKRLILFHRVIRDADGVLAATNEAKFLGFNLTERRAETWRPRVAEKLAEVMREHRDLLRPEQAGLGIALKRR
ncbi:MAG: hypothetical protein GKR99_14660 [Rhodobacteraceae bacterium]|nr:hypothetical protein [Paracoccaceae bacterium]